MFLSSIFYEFDEFKRQGLAMGFKYVASVSLFIEHIHISRVGESIYSGYLYIASQPDYRVEGLAMGYKYVASLSLFWSPKGSFIKITSKTVSSPVVYI